MSRVSKPVKFMNTNKYSSSVTNAGKLERSKAEHTDYTKANTLTSWLFLKYDMSYKTYRNKSKARREELRQEYVEDTGNMLKDSYVDTDFYDEDDEDWMGYMAENGFPFDECGEPVGW